MVKVHETLLKKLKPTEEHAFLGRAFSRFSLHSIVQTLFLFYFIVVGLNFCMYVAWALGQSAIYVAKPAAVEAFLPISALLACKRFFLTGVYDQVHPAGLTIFLFALFSAILWRKSFCGYFCPLGALSSMAFNLGRCFGLVRDLPRWATLVLLAPKYVLLAFFLALPFYFMALPEIESFLSSHYNLVCDTKLLLFFLKPSGTLLLILALLLVASFFFPAFWCRAFCPYGALLGLLALLSPTAIWREKALCTSCAKCSKACPQGLKVHTFVRLNHPECTSCLECVNSCQNSALSIRLGWRNARSLKPTHLVCLVLVTFFLFYLLALLSGHWVSKIPVEMVRMLHENIEQISHF
ncbi:MAG: 4Fe-4S binding protein [Desulfovibrio sp.]|nr:4Fe-4S binding protein [Desulfovibrio sp.]